jgi:hypothetical protein
VNQHLLQKVLLNQNQINQDQEERKKKMKENY